MLTYRLTGTTEAIGINHDEPDQSSPQPPPAATATSAQSSWTLARPDIGAALLTCKKHRSNDGLDCSNSDRFATDCHPARNSLRKAYSVE
jgi:hypothetical protein